jgi:WD40 repeat protein
MVYLMHPTRSAAMSFEDGGGAALLSLEGEAPRLDASFRIEGIGRLGALATNGERVFHAGGEDGTLLELAWGGGGSVLSRAKLPAELTFAEALSSDGRWVMRMDRPSLMRSPTPEGVYILDRSSGQVRVLPLPSEFTSPASFDPGSKRFAAVHTEQGGGGIAVWDLDALDAPRRDIQRDEMDNDLADSGGSCVFSADGGTLVVWSTSTEGEGYLHAVDVERRTERWMQNLDAVAGVDLFADRSLDEESFDVRLPAVSRDGALVAWGTERGDVLVFDARSGKLSQRARFGEGRIRAVHFDPARPWIWAELGGVLIGRALGA